MIEFIHVTKIYKSGDKQVKAVDDVNLHVEKGQICVFIGPSGCGKTTLLRMVNRLISLTSGKIHVDGKDISQLNPIELRRSIGYVIQQVGLFPNMTIEENVAVVPNMLGWDRVKIRKRYNELMEMVGLDPDEYRKRYPWELSGGQQQRVGVARALAADPPVMLMDEPFGALDPLIRDKLQNEFIRIQENLHKTILFVSHDIDEAIKLGDTIAIFKSGQLMQHGTPDEILSNPKNEFVLNFVGSDRALKRLTLFTVRDLLGRIENFHVRTVRKENHDFVVRPETDLRAALSVVLSSPSGEAWVVDEHNQRIGVVNLQDFEIVTGLHSVELKSIVNQG